ncbi:MAG TPA: hypothetical protein VJ784_13310 [Pyrinomonadaceae bacterium]|jgi:hypothetical protein|nr:hypothetical protein [Pyrinomonadaceae bacterium]
MSRSVSKDTRWFLSIYSILLIAYPREFRQEYGSQMVLLLLDCQRDAPTAPARTRIWLRTLIDLVRTAPREHLEKIRKENTFMSNLRNDLLAIGGCVLIILAALLLLNYGRSHQVSSILFFGYVLDAIAFTGILGNLIVFLLIKLTRFRPLRIAFWTFLIVTLVPALAITLFAGRDPHFNAPNVLIGYVVSFFFWYGLHWLWSNKLRPSETV